MFWIFSQGLFTTRESQCESKNFFWCLKFFLWSFFTFCRSEQSFKNLTLINSLFNNTKLTFLLFPFDIKLSRKNLSLNRRYYLTTVSYEVKLKIFFKVWFFSSISSDCSSIFLAFTLSVLWTLKWQLVLKILTLCRISIVFLQTSLYHDWSQFYTLVLKLVMLNLRVHCEPLNSS